jgi:hypothetical protein
MKPLPNSQRTAIPHARRHRPNQRLRQIASRWLPLVALGLTWLAPLVASATERIPVTEIKPLLMRAAAQGTAHGVLTGVGAAYLQRRFDTTSTVEIDVRRLKALPQPGCSRLEVTTRQRAVLVKGQRDTRELVYQLNYCADGGFPEDR